MGFGDRLRKLREGKNLNQTELGKIFNLSKQAISSYETGGSTPSQDTLQKMADFFNTTADWLLGRDESRTQTKNYLEILDALEDSNTDITAGGQPLTKEQRVSILRALVSPSSLPTSKKLTVPIIGTIRTGIPLLSEQNFIGEVDIPVDLEGHCDFALYVSGDSMIGAGIAEHDIVICKEYHFPNNGDIVVALVNNDETTLKFFIRTNGTNGRDFLRAANPNYEDIELKPGDQIQGKVVKVFKDPPSVNIYRDYIYLRDEHLVDWNEVIEKATSYGIKPGKIKAILDMHYEMSKR